MQPMARSSNQHGASISSRTSSAASFRNVPSKYLTIDEVATLVHHRGATTLPGAPPDTNRGSVVACFHDAGGNGNDFADLLTALAGDQSPLSFDMPGHGRSAGLDSVGSVSSMANHGRSLLDGFGLSNVVLVGEGLGAAVAIELASMAPQLVAGLILIGGVAASFDVSADIESLAAITAGRARREFDRSGYAPETDRSVYQKAFTEWVKTDPRATLGDRRGQAEWSLGDRQLSVPILVVVGEHQESASVEAAKALSESMSAQVEVLSGAGRRGVLEQPDAFAVVISTFIEGLT
jgi:pimeloyl-ACP methyl ester carboxylesterase